MSLRRQIARLASRRGPLLALAVPVLAAAATPADAACTVTTPAPASIGSVSPAALKAGAPPYVRVAGGFSCPGGSVLTLLGGNYLKATVAAGTVLQLTSTTTGDVATYALAADADGTNPLVPGAATYYINGTLLNLVGLLGPSAVNVPMFVRPQSMSRIAAGTYTGSFAVRWDWYFCSLIGVGGVCVGSIDSDTKTITIAVSMVVVANDVTITLTPSTTWNPVEASGNPKAIPGGKVRLAIAVSNPDIVPVDANALVLTFPAPAALIVALDGDGASAAPAIQLTQGATPSNLTLNYATPASMTDDVDFSADNGATWTYVPIVGDPMSQARVTHIRIRPRGTMAPQSSFSISISAALK